MPDNDSRTYYVICEDNCKFESMTKEQIIAAIAEATGATPTQIDDAFITKIKEQNHNSALKWWVGTQAQYNAITTKSIDTLYIITDANEFDDLRERIYPIGSIYLSVLNTSPASLYGGTWERIKDTFLLASGDTYVAGNTGGSADAVVVTHFHSDILYEANDKKLTTDSGTEANKITITANGGNGGGASIYTKSAGESGTGKNMPPYLTVYMWKRVA